MSEVRRLVKYLKATHNFWKQFQLLAAFRSDEVNHALDDGRGQDVVPLQRVKRHSESEVQLA